MTAAGGGTMNGSTAPAASGTGTGPGSVGAQVGNDLLRLENLTHHYRAPRRQKVHAVEDLSLTVAPGEALGLVGESGCGKSTVARCVVGLIRPTAGQIIFDGTDIWKQSAKWRRRTFARQVAIVFQDPTSSLNPRLKVRDTLADPLIIHGIGDRDSRRDATGPRTIGHGPPPPRRSRTNALKSCPEVNASEWPSPEPSPLNPSLLVADEPTSALDVSVQNQILNLVAELRDALNLSVILISHNIQAVSWLVDRVAVMYLGHKVEEGPVAEVRDHRLHPYTRALLSASPMITTSSERIILEGTLPNPRNPPSGMPLPDPLLEDRGGLREAEFPPADIPVEGHSKCIATSPKTRIRPRRTGEGIEHGGGPTSHRGSRQDSTGHL